MFAALACTPLLACSSSASEEDGDNADEGALHLSDDALLEAVLGEVSRGQTLPSDFMTKSAAEKQSIAWSTATKSSELRCHLGSTVAGDALVSALAACKVGTDSDDMKAATLLGTLSRASYQIFMGVLGASGTLTAAFDTPGDELPRLRKKLLHPFGSIAKVELRVEENSAYTGVLRPGAVVPGIARLSSGGPEKVMGFVPGLGLKLFTGGGQSVDFHALNSLAKQTLEDGKTMDHNFFSRPFSNEIVRSDNEGAGALVEKIFAKVHPTPTHLPVDHMGLRSVDGEPESAPKSPQDIVFDPPAELTKSFQSYIDANPESDPRVALAYVTKDATVQNPVVLYKVRVGTAERFQKADKATADASFPVVATLVATSAFLPSKWGDGQLYMRHNRGCKPVMPGAHTAASPSLCPSR